jgi:hypothetical protein
LHRAGQVRIVELVGVPNSLVGRQFEVLPAERVALACREVRERHLVRAANAGVDVVNLAGESVWGKPFDLRVRIEERSIDPLGLGPQDSVKADCAGHDAILLSMTGAGIGPL